MERTVLAYQLDVKLGVINLPYGVGPERFAPMDQMKTLAVRAVAPLSQHQQSCWEVPYDPATDRMAGYALSENLGHRALTNVFSCMSRLY
jgi:hypothetical protein